MFKKFALDFCGKIVPLHDDCGAEAPQNNSSSLVRGASSLLSSCGAPFGAPPSLSQRAMALLCSDPPASLGSFLLIRLIWCAKRDVSTACDSGTALTAMDTPIRVASEREADGHPG